MRARQLAILSLTVLCHAAFGQAVAPNFQFPANVKPGDTLTITGTDLGSITGVTLKAEGKSDLPATNVRANAESVTFTAPSTAGGSYSVVLSPGAIPPIPLTVAAAPAATDPAPRLYMPDGQLRSHAVRVYLERDLGRARNVRLQLLRSRAVTKKDVQDAKTYEPGVIAPGNQWTERVDEADFRRTGTLLLFDLGAVDVEYKAMLRVRPVLRWTEDGVERVATGGRDVNLGDVVYAAGWTGLIVVVTVVAIWGLARAAGFNPLGFFAGVEGHLSLAQAQVACWTIAIGGIVLGYGLIRQQNPEIPTSLLVLMGASLATGGIGFMQDAKASGGAPKQDEMHWGDLVRDFKSGQTGALSLAKAQMIFWTVLLLVLFISKSLLDGAVWDVPWPLVALMGFSQAGFLAPKIASSPGQPQQQQTPPAQGDAPGQQAQEGQPEKKADAAAGGK